MGARSIFCTAILVAVVFEECSTLRGGEDAVCPEFSYPPGFNDDSDFEPHDSFSGDHADDDNDEEILSTREPMELLHRSIMIIEKCCKGYVNNGGTCEPQCESGCENGYCSKPGKCSCDPGYEETPLNTCIPKCDQDCINGNCTGSDECTCNEGYRLSADAFTCVPVCSSTCENGLCIGPELCHCFPGYKRNDANECKPVCKLECENGKCVDPNVCECNHGYKKNASNRCEPDCQMSCINGKCVGPDRCECDVGFQPVKENVFACEPICSQPCGSGAICTAPETCTCNEAEARNGSCAESLCKTSCNQGICTSKGCACLYGWVGDSCDEPLFCTVTQPADVSVVNKQNPSAKPTMINIEDENYQFKWQGPTCHEQCLDQLNTAAVNLTRTNGIMTQYFVPVDSSCNVIKKSPEPSMWSSSVIWTVIGIASIAIVVLISIILMRMRQRPRIGEYTHRLVNDLVEVERIVHL